MWRDGFSFLRQLLGIFFFGMVVGFHNDFSVLHRSPVSSKLVEGNAFVVSYETNDNVS
jgi:hypothetical protein